MSVTGVFNPVTTNTVGATSATCVFKVPNNPASEDALVINDSRCSPLCAFKESDGRQCCSISSHYLHVSKKNHFQDKSWFMCEEHAIKEFESHRDSPEGPEFQIILSLVISIWEGHNIHDIKAPHS
jgi:hypothetical protein